MCRYLGADVGTDASSSVEVPGLLGSIACLSSAAVLLRWLPLQRTIWGKMWFARAKCYVPLHYYMHVQSLCMCHQGRTKIMYKLFVAFQCQDIVYIQVSMFSFEVSRFSFVPFLFVTFAAIHFAAFLEKSLYAPCASSCKGAWGLWHSPAAVHTGVRAPMQKHQAKATHYAWTREGRINVYIYFDLFVSYILLLADLHFYCIARESDATTAPLYHSFPSGLSHSLMHPCSP